MPGGGDKVNHRVAWDNSIFAILRLIKSLYLNGLKFLNSQLLSQFVSFNFRAVKIFLSILKLWILYRTYTELFICLQIKTINLVNKAK